MAQQPLPFYVEDGPPRVAPAAPAQPPRAPRRWGCIGLAVLAVVLAIVLLLWPKDHSTASDAPSPTAGGGKPEDAPSPTADGGNRGDGHQDAPSPTADGGNRGDGHQDQPSPTAGGGKPEDPTLGSGDKPKENSLDALARKKKLEKQVKDKKAKEQGTPLTYQEDDDVWSRYSVEMATPSDESTSSDPTLGGGDKPKDPTLGGGDKPKDPPALGGDGETKDPTLGGGDKPKEQGTPLTYQEDDDVWSRYSVENAGLLKTLEKLEKQGNEQKEKENAGLLKMLEKLEKQGNEQKEKDKQIADDEAALLAVITKAQDQGTPLTGQEFDDVWTRYQVDGLTHTAKDVHDARKRQIEETKAIVTKMLERKEQQEKDEGAHIAEETKKQQDHKLREEIKKLWGKYMEDTWAKYEENGLYCSREKFKGGDGYSFGRPPSENAGDTWDTLLKKLDKHLEEQKAQEELKAAKKAALKKLIEEAKEIAGMLETLDKLEKQNEEQKLKDLM